MGHQLANRNPFFAVASEGGPVSRDGGGEVDPAALAKLHYRERGRGGLGQRGEIENCVGSHRDSPGLKRAISESVAINDLDALPDLDDGAESGRASCRGRV